MLSVTLGVIIQFNETNLHILRNLTPWIASLYKLFRFVVPYQKEKMIKTLRKTAYRFLHTRGHKRSEELTRAVDWGNTIAKGLRYHGTISDGMKQNLGKYVVKSWQFYGFAMIGRELVRSLERKINALRTNASDPKLERTSSRHGMIEQSDSTLPFMKQKKFHCDL